jgi:hypothetical protein
MLYIWFLIGGGGGKEFDFGLAGFSASRPYAGVVCAVVRMAEPDYPKWLTIFWVMGFRRFRSTIEARFALEQADSQGMPYAYVRELALRWFDKNCLPS